MLSWWNRPVSAHTSIVVILLGLILIGFLYIAPTGKYVLKPVEPVSIHDYINSTIESPNTGKILITPVGVYERLFTIPSIPAIEANYLILARAKIDKQSQIRTVREVVSEQTTNEEYKKINKAINTHAKLVPIAVAFDHAQVPYTINGDGVIVTGFTEDGNARSYLQAGDIIVAVNEDKISFIEDLLEDLQNEAPQSYIDVTVQRAEQELTYDIQLQDNSLGLFGNTHNLHVKHELGEHLEILPIEGSSGDLMIALEIYSRLTGEDLVRGRTISGSAGLGIDGKTRAVQGAELKVFSAAGNGIDMFFLSEAQQMPEREDIEIVYVDHFEEAVNYLRVS